MWKPDHPIFVIKLTKFCNMRCKYCYEFPYLADKTKMELPQVELLLKNIASTLVENNITKSTFLWHGGEPFVLSPEYFSEIYYLQNLIFKKTGITFKNVVQTNLTIFDEGHFDLLKEGKINEIGVSIDLFGDDRVNIGGKVLDDITLSNMQLLVNAGISFGAISILSKNTSQHILKLFNFFDELNVSWRILPIDMLGFENQHDKNLLTSDEVVEVYKAVFEKWLLSNNKILIEPINEYLESAIASFNPDYVLYKFDKDKDDYLFVINTNGDVYSEVDSYNITYSYGNIFQTPLKKLIDSNARKRVISRAKSIISSTCIPCRYYGYCDGFRMAESTTEKIYWKNNNINCTIIRPMIDYFRGRIIEEGLVFSNHKNYPTLAFRSS